MPERKRVRSAAFLELVLRAPAARWWGAGSHAARAARGWTLVGTREAPSAELVPSLLAASDVLGTGWFAAHAANVKPGATVVVVGDGAVGLLAVLSAAQTGAERIIAMSRHESRQKLASDFGATALDCHALQGSLWGVFASSERDASRIVSELAAVQLGDERLQ